MDEDLDQIIGFLNSKDGPAVAAAFASHNQVAKNQQTAHWPSEPALLDEKQKME